MAREALENLEDAHNLVMRLGKERESLAKKSKRLEDEVATAKGEILRLRSEMNASTKTKEEEAVVQQQSDSDKEEAVVTATAKRGGRRRKASSQ